MPLHPTTGSHNDTRITSQWISKTESTVSSSTKILVEEVGNISELLEDIMPNNHGVSVDDVLNPDGEDD